MNPKLVANTPLIQGDTTSRTLSDDQATFQEVEDVAGYETPDEGKENRVPFFNANRPPPRRRPEPVMLSVERNHYHEILHRLTAVKEKCRRLEQRIMETEQEASATAELKDNQISILTQRVNFLQHRDDPLNDDEAVRIMRQLGQQLDIWVKVNFRDPARLNTLTTGSMPCAPQYMGRVDDPKNVHERRAFIQGFASACIHGNLFAPKFLGILDLDAHNYFDRLDGAIQKHCPIHVNENWRLATSIATASLSQEQGELAICNTIQEIESSVGKFASTDLDTRLTKLKSLLSRCMELKYRLERQEDRYHFTYPLSETMFCPDNMHSITGDYELGATVQFSVWPGLWKNCRGHYQLIHPETVWTKATEA